MNNHNELAVTYVPRAISVSVIIRRFHVAVLAGALLFCTGSVVMAQYNKSNRIEDINAMQIVDLERRMEIQESKGFDAKIARLETMTESNQTMLIGICLAVVALLFEAAVRVVRQRGQNGSKGGD